jgi:hypothetical protein
MTDAMWIMVIALMTIIFCLTSSVLTILHARSIERMARLVKANDLGELEAPKAPKVTNNLKEGLIKTYTMED